MLSYIFHRLKTDINLKKSFSKSFFGSVLNLVFFSMYGFNHVSWLNWITLCTFCNIILWFKACFRALLLYEQDILFYHTNCIQALLIYSYTYFFFFFAYLCIAWHVLPLIPFSNIINISLSVNNSNFIRFFF